jgi:dihydrolipoamide dehydrogenase
MSKQLDIAILGAGTAGLNAMGQVRRHTKNFLLIDGAAEGELGTTCARVGCMPSKAMIHIAEDFHARKQFRKLGIEGGESLSIDSAAVMERVQDVRDILVDRVLSNTIDKMGDKFVNEYAQFIDAHTLQLGDQTVEIGRCVIATGSRPVVPEAWQSLGDQILTTDSFFEQQDLPASMAVIGLGVIGLELGQALSQLGVEVTGVDALTTIAGLRDSEINRCAIDLIQKEFPLILGQTAQLEKVGGLIRVTAGDHRFDVERVLVSIGRRSNIDRVGLENLGIVLDDQGLPAYDIHTMALKEAPHIFLAGDVNVDTPILHEASYEGKIAGYNAGTGSLIEFKRYVPLHITFSDPNICQVGQSLDQLDETRIVIGKFSMGPHGRALVMGNNRGLIHLYADKTDGTLLGACMVAPRAEHLAHLIAWCLEQKLSLLEMLRFPFYHPVFEEALQGAIRDALGKTALAPEIPAELTLL